MLWIFLSLVVTVLGKLEIDLENGDVRAILANVVKDLNAKDKRIAALENEVRFLRDRVNTQQSPDNAVISDITNERIDETDHVTTRRGSNSNQIMSRQAINERPVAFYAYLSKHALHLGAHQPVIFDTVHTNVANGYHSTLGTFIAPVHGMYVFSVTIMSYPGNTAHYQIMKAGNQVGILYPSGNSASAYETASQTIVIEVSMGDDVEVQNLDSNENIHGGPYTSFSGFLLYEIEGAVPVGRK